jgi:hypothetical protein
MQLFYTPAGASGVSYPIAPGSYGHHFVVSRATLPDTDLPVVQARLQRLLANVSVASWRDATFEFRMSDGTVHRYGRTLVTFIDAVEA